MFSHYSRGQAHSTRGDGRFDQSAGRQPTSLLGVLEAQNAALRNRVAELIVHNERLRERGRQACMGAWQVPSDATGRF